MINPVQGSELAEQIELARQGIEEWPRWLKNSSQTACPDDQGQSNSDSETKSASR